MANVIEALDELKLELLRARNELTFLLSEQICGRDCEVQLVRRRISELLETINVYRNATHGWPAPSEAPRTQGGGGARSDSTCGIRRRRSSSRPGRGGTAEAMVEQANGRSRGSHTCLVALKVPRAHSGGDGVERSDPHRWYWSRAIFNHQSHSLGCVSAEQSERVNND
jgi:hypothetical protein